MSQKRTRTQILLERRPLIRILSLLAACLIFVVVVGSLLLVVNAAQQRQSTANQTISSKATPTKSPPKTEPPGTIVWKSEAYDMNFGTQWSPDGKRMVSVLNRTALTSWDAKTGAHKLTYKTPGEMTLSDIAWSPNSALLAVAGKETIYIFDAQSTHQVRTLKITDARASTTSGIVTNGYDIQQGKFLHSMVSLSGADFIDKMIWSSDGKYIAAAYHGDGPQSQIFIWDAKTGLPIKALSGFPSTIVDISWSPDGSALATLAYPAYMDGVMPAVKIWDVHNWNVIKEYPNIYAMSWSPEGKRLALADASDMGGKDIRIVDARSGQVLKQLVQEKYIFEISWSPDGSRIVLASGMKHAIQLLNASNGSLLYSFSQCSEFRAWSPDSKYIACSQSNKHTDPQTNELYYDSSILIWRAA